MRNENLFNETVLKRAIRSYGQEAQMAVVQEECAELIVAISHFLRRRVDDKVVIEEIADVQVMVNQMKIMFGAEAVQKVYEEKVLRLSGRLDKEEDI